jgi:glycerol-3-phosphate dehydrogenase
MSSKATPPTKITKVCVFGAGQFGFALAALLGHKYSDLKVVMYDTVKVRYHNRAGDPLVYRKLKNTETVLVFSVFLACRNT